MSRIGIIGFGAIGRDLAGRLRRDGHDVVLLLRPGSASRDRAASFAIAESVEVLIAAAPAIVVEAAGQAALAAFAPDLLAAGLTAVAASTGALADADLFQRLEAAARAGSGRLVIPAGALGGLDYLAALRGTTGAAIRYTSRKPPAAWRDELASAGHDPDRLAGPVVLFDGDPAEAARRYPRNLNAGLTVALAAAPAAVTVRVVADPGVTLNTHEIECDSALGTAHMRFANRPAPDNPKTSALTAASLTAAVRRLLDPVAI